MVFLMVLRVIMIEIDKPTANDIYGLSKRKGEISKKCNEYQMLYHWFREGY